MNEELIRQIAEEVLRQISGDSFSHNLPEQCENSLLAVGCPQAVPEELRENYRICDLDDFIKHQDIMHYKRIVITALTLTELSDIAQGRDADAASRAVVEGLLSGVDVFLLEKGLPHRRFAGKGNSHLYEVIEDHVRTLQTYGIRIIPEKKITVPRKAAKPKYQAPPVQAPAGSSQPNRERLITEEKALELAAGGQKEVCIAANAIVTPLAWDIFTHHKIHVIRK